MRVLGIDPGTWKTGVGVVTREDGKYHAVHYETLVLKRQQDHLSIAKRLKKLYDSLNEVLKIYKPDVVALEDVFFGKNFNSAICIGEARAVAILAAANFNIEVVEYKPTRVKQAVSGNGQASKIQMQYMIRHLLNLRENPEADAADALAIALCHCHTIKHSYVQLS